jgi:hypothetical protein
MRPKSTILKIATTTIKADMMAMATMGVLRKL